MMLKEGGKRSFWVLLPHIEADGCLVSGVQRGSLLISNVIPSVIWNNSVYCRTMANGNFV
jgi:hypothetical protein